MKYSPLPLLLLVSLTAGPVNSDQTAGDRRQPTRLSEGQRPVPPRPEYAVFTEFSPAKKALKSGWNTRVYTDTDVKQGDSIQCDFETGLITLAPGSYHISGYSMVVYDSGGEPPEMATIRAPAAGGYSRLRIHDPKRKADQSDMRSLGNADPSVIGIGSPSTPNMTPSIFDAYFTTDKVVQILLEHQSGNNPDHIYLRIYIENSKWHALARISIRRL